MPLQTRLTEAAQSAAHQLEGDLRTTATASHAVILATATGSRRGCPA